jgi:glycine oxidase
MAHVLATGELPEEARPFTPRRFAAAALTEQPA